MLVLYLCFYPRCDSSALFRTRGEGEGRGVWRRTWSNPDNQFNPLPFNLSLFRGPIQLVFFQAESKLKGREGCMKEELTTPWKSVSTPAIQLVPFLRKHSTHPFSSRIQIEGKRGVYEGGADHALTTSFNPRHLLQPATSTAPLPYLGEHLPCLELPASLKTLHPSTCNYLKLLNFSPFYFVCRFEISVLLFWFKTW